MENVRKHRDIKLVTTDTRRNQVVSERLQYNNMIFSRLISKKMKKILIKILQMKLKKDMIHQIMELIDHYQTE